MRRPPSRHLVCLTFAALRLAAQDPVPALESGPKPGAPLPACPVYAPAGPFAGQEFDVAARIGVRPGAILFVHELTRNTGPMISGLDRLGVQLAWTGLEVHTVRVGQERSEAEVATKRSSEAMGLHRPILVSTDGIEGPGAFALNRRATLTLVLAREGKVVESVAFTDTGRGDLQRLRTLVETATGPVPTDPVELKKAIEARLTRDPEALRALVVDLALLLQRVERVEQNRMQREQQRGQMPPRRGEGGEPAAQPRPDPARPREGKAPEDEELRNLLRRCIQRSADAAELDAAFAAVDARVGDDAGLRSQAVEMFRLMLSLDYGNDAGKQRAKDYVAKHGAR